MKLKITMTLNVSVSKVIELPEGTKIVNGILPKHVQRDIDYIKRSELYEAMADKFKANPQPKTTIKLIYNRNEM